jgi:peptide chain release factor subunit 3
MSGNYDSWEEAAAQDEDLSRQAQNMNINANSFRPGASSFQPGATSFQPGQQYPQNGYQNYGYGQQQQGFNQYSQYGPGYNQYSQYQQQPQQQQPPQQPPQQQQGYNQGYGGGGGQFAAYNQTPGGFQPRQGAPISIAKRSDAQPASTQQPASQARPAPAPAAAQAPAPAAAPAPKPAPKPAAAAPPKAKVLSIGVPTPAAGAPKKPASPTTKELPKSEAKADAGAKVAAAKAVEKTGEKVSGKTSPSPSSGKSSPTPGDAKKARNAEELLQEQTADVEASVLEEMYGKEHVNIIFIGHVDAGKSTLGGQVLIQTGMVDERTLEKYKRDAKDAGRETWYISWVLDLNKEERAKGKTVEVGRGFFETEKRKYTILDAPGHKTYVPNMLSGAAQADVAILVISARKGEFETGFEKGGQTQEHAMLIKTTGAKEVVVAVNKMDDITVGWSKERYDEIVGKLKPYLKKRIGLDSTFLPISAQTGYGVRDKIPTEVAGWYEGPSLLELLDGMAKIQRNVNAPFMMPVGAKYRDMGTMIEGRIEAGVIQKSATYVMMPNREEVGIAALYGETEEEIPHAMCGEQVRMRLRGIEEEDIMPGFVLCSPKRLVHCVREFEAQISIVDLKSILSAGFNCVIHVHAATEEVTFAALLHKLEPKTGRKSKKPPPFAAKGQNIIARLQVTSGAGKICVERFEDYPQLGRFTLRDQGQTIAVGKITKLIMED